MYSVYSAQGMKRILTAAILAPLVLLLIFKAPFWLMPWLAGIVAELAAWEFLGIANASGARTPRILVLIAIAVLFFFSFGLPYQVAPVLSALSLAIFAFCAFRGPLEGILTDVSASVFCIVYIGLSMATIPWLAAQENGPSLLAFLLGGVREILRRYISERPTGGTSWLPPSARIRHGREQWPRWSAACWLGCCWSIYRCAGGGSTWKQPAGVSWVGLSLGVPRGAAERCRAGWRSGRVCPQTGSGCEGFGNAAAGSRRSAVIASDALLLAAPVLWYAQLIQQPF